MGGFDVKGDSRSIRGSADCEMALMRAMNLDRDTEIASWVERPSTFLGRAIGLLYRSTLPEGAALLLDPCRSVHTFGMRFRIDVLFLDPQGQVVRVYRLLRPLRFTRFCMNARSALEVAAGTIDRTGTKIGDRVLFTS